MGNKQRAAFTRKDNFWSRQRVEKRMTLREIGELLGEDEKRIGAYFSGFCLPKPYIIKELCELFEVDFEQGELEFQHAHRQWQAEHHATLKYSAKVDKKQKKIDTVEDILTSLYGVLSCAEFIDIYNVVTGSADKTVNPFEIIYGKVDYDIYCKIDNLINRKGD